MKKQLIIFTFIMALGACSPQPHKTLNEKLSEATDMQDRKEVLRLACLNEAEWVVRSTKNKYRGKHASSYRMNQIQDNPEVRSMKELCRQMDNLTTLNTEHKSSSQDLLASCMTKASEKKQNKSNGWVEHANRIANICKEMTKKKE